MDKSGVQGIDMSSYIRKYAHYLNEKRETYKLMGYDFYIRNFKNFRYNLLTKKIITIFNLGCKDIFNKRNE
jgi:hypothetical protein